jgi:hypothetical protein
MMCVFASLLKGDGERHEASPCAQGPSRARALAAPFAAIFGRRRGPPPDRIQDDGAGPRDNPRKRSGTGTPQARCPVAGRHRGRAWVGALPKQIGESLQTLLFDIFHFTQQSG